MEENKRIAPRQRVLKAARIVFDDLSTMDVGLRDLSATGAKLIVGNGLLIPNTFRLIVNADQSIRPAKVAWRKESQIGIEFTGEAKSAVLRKT
jgi:hypothetical protein